MDSNLQPPDEEIPGRASKFNYSGNFNGSNRVKLDRQTHRCRALIIDLTRDGRCRRSRSCLADREGGGSVELVDQLAKPPMAPAVEPENDPGQIGDLRLVWFLRTVVCSVESASRVSFGNCTNDL
jgi:hypothetical protein